MSSDPGVLCSKFEHDPLKAGLALNSVELVLRSEDYEWTRRHAGPVMERQLRAVRLQTLRESLGTIRQEAWIVFDAWRRCAAEKGDFSGVGDPVLVLVRIWLFLGMLEAVAFWKIGFGLPAPAIYRVVGWCRKAIIPLGDPCECLPEETA